MGDEFDKIGLRFQKEFDSRPIEVSPFKNRSFITKDGSELQTISEKIGNIKEVVEDLVDAPPELFKELGRNLQDNIAVPSSTITKQKQFFSRKSLDEIRRFQTAVKQDFHQDQCNDILHFS